MKKILSVHANPNQHWVGDGFPVRTLFYYDTPNLEISPFLLLDFAGPHHFAPATRPRGVGQHPHRGFETVTIVYEGEVSHRDSTGNGGVIGPGDVQWMTAAGGILHEEFHSPAFTLTGGPFRMVQLWVNLPAASKMLPPRYQSLFAKQMPHVDLGGNGSELRVIAGDFAGHQGPAKTFTAINVWDLKLSASAAINLPLPDGHTTMLVVLAGQILVNGSHAVGEAQMVMLDRSGDSATVDAESAATVLVLTGEPINEPVVGHGPFVMNTDAQIDQAIDEFNSGRFGVIDHA